MKYIIMLFLIVGCADQKPTDDAIASPASTDSLFKSWTHALHLGGPNWSVNLSNSNLVGVFKLRWNMTVAPGVICESDAVMSETIPGDKSAGTFVTSGTATIVGDPTGPPCSRFNDTWTWTIANDQLTVCGSVNAFCVVYE